jgi:predicted DNA binding CopG/RHH family protein
MDTTEARTMSTQNEKILGTDEAWDEGRLGADEQYVAKSTHSTDEDINDALSLQPISIRLQKGLIDNLKTIAELNGIGYQPLIRQALTRFVECEMKQIALEALANQRKQEQLAKQMAAEEQLAQEAARKRA